MGIYVCHSSGIEGCSYERCSFGRLPLEGTMRPPKSESGNGQQILKSHRENQHALEFAKYSKFGIEERRNCFDRDLHESQGIQQMFTLATGSIKEKLTFVINKNIVEDIIGCLLMESEDDEETGGAKLRSKTLSIFHRQEAGGENISGYYEVYVTNTLQFRLVINWKFSDGEVISYVRTVCAVNLQRISQIFYAVWAFSIAFDCGIKGDQEYLDVCLRFALKGQLFNIHLMAIPMHQSHPDTICFF
ncbi:hypothetical protein PsorP6_010983 [Peronosclerospora sorghi]|uniref:Uncharacterized protein n=1 Tax=Peronosclerospora sorghi TaxID=230839 RepID=A0ACC0VW46_9STRA|nr:hypothetical protein PsorP6_010983 [Peronosclerospora sorghi]